MSQCATSWGVAIACRGARSDLLASLRDLICVTSWDFELKQWVEWLIYSGSCGDATRVTCGHDATWIVKAYIIVFSAGDAWKVVRRSLRDYLLICCVGKLGTSRWLDVHAELLRILAGLGYGDWDGDLSSQLYNAYQHLFPGQRTGGRRRKQRASKICVASSSPPPSFVPMTRLAGTHGSGAGELTQYSVCSMYSALLAGGFCVCRF